MKPYWVNRTNYRDLSLKVFGEYFVSQFSPVIYYPFAETSGTTIADYSGNGNDATAVGSPDLNISAPYLQDGLLADAQGAIRFNESAGQYLSAPNASYGNAGAFSIVTWIHPYYMSADRAIFSRNYGGIHFELLIDTHTLNREISFLLRTDTSGTVVARFDNFLYHAALRPLMLTVAVDAGGTIDLWVNNYLADSLAIPSFDGGAGNLHVIGCRDPVSTSNSIDARLLAFGVTDTKLTASDVSKLWEIGAGNQRPTGVFFNTEYTDKHSAPITYEAGLKRARRIRDGSNFVNVRLGESPLSGRKYWEIKIYANFDNNLGLGLSREALNSQYGVWSGNGPRISYAFSSGSPYVTSHNFTKTTAANNWTLANGSIAMFAYDADSGKLWFGVDGVWAHGDPATLTNESATSGDPAEPVYPGARLDNASIIQAFTEPGELTYSVPDGFSALGG